MIRLFAAMLLLAADIVARAEDHAVRFSPYSDALMLASYDGTSSTARFEGQVKLSGQLVIEFDQGEPSHMVGVNVAKFVPDPASRATLPAVVAGFYPGPIEYISLEPAERGFASAFGTDAERILKGRDTFVQKAVQVTIRAYTASVECDARDYFAELVAVAPAVQTVASLQGPPAGC